MTGFRRDGTDNILDIRNFVHGFRVAILLVLNKHPLCLLRAAGAPLAARRTVQVVEAAFEHFAPLTLAIVKGVSALVIDLHVWPHGLSPLADSSLFNVHDLFYGSRDHR